MAAKRIQLILNAIAWVAIIIYSIWITVIWWQNPEWSQMMLFRHTWQGLVIVVVSALPAIIYPIYCEWCKD